MNLSHHSNQQWWMTPNYCYLGGPIWAVSTCHVNKFEMVKSDLSTYSLLIQATIKMKVAKSSGKSQGNGHPLIEICQNGGNILGILLEYFYFEPKHLRLWNNGS